MRIASKVECLIRHWSVKLYTQEYLLAYNGERKSGKNNSIECVDCSVPVVNERFDVEIHKKSDTYWIYDRFWNWMLVSICVPFLKSAQFYSQWSRIPSRGEIPLDVFQNCYVTGFWNWKLIYFKSIQQL